MYFHSCMFNSYKHCTYTPYSRAGFAAAYDALVLDPALVGQGLEVAREIWPGNAIYIYTYLYYKYMFISFYYYHI